MINIERYEVVPQNLMKEIQSRLENERENENVPEQKLTSRLLSYFIPTWDKYNKKQEPNLN